MTDIDVGTNGELYLQVCHHTWTVWDEGAYRQHRSCSKCGSEQWRDSMLPKTGS